MLFKKELHIKKSQLKGGKKNEKEGFSYVTQRSNGGFHGSMRQRWK